MARSRYNMRHVRNVPIKEARYIRTCVCYNAANTRRPIRLAFNFESNSGLGYDFQMVDLSIVEATELCDMLADLIGRVADMPADF